MYYSEYCDSNSCVTLEDTLFFNRVGGNWTSLDLEVDFKMFPENEF